MFDLDAARNAVRKVLDTMDVYGYTVDGIDANLKVWEKNKSPLVELLRHHPNWCEEACAIIIDQNIPHLADKEKATLLLDACCMSVASKLDSYVDIPTSLFTKTNVDQEMVDETLKIIEESTDLVRQSFGHIKAGMKTSRFIRGAFAKMGVNVDSRDFLEFFAPYADEIANVRNENQIVVLSANPGDFLSMSYGTNWASCHIINPYVAITHEGCSFDGCYKAGCLSYANDPSTLILYTVERLPEDLSDLPTMRKATRQLFHVNLDAESIMQSRLYPYGENDYRFPAYRNSVQSIMSKCMDVPNHWKLTRGNNETMFKTYPGARHYPDYDYSSNGINIFRPSCSCGEYHAVYIGDSSYCLNCGGIVDEDNQIFCDDCGGYDGPSCDCCGEHVDEDELYYCEDTNDYRCAECSWYCEVCNNNYSHNMDHTYIDGRDVCADCLEQSGEYVQCSECDEWIYVDNAYYTDCDEDTEYPLCEGCYRDLPVCEHCGQHEHDRFLNDTSCGIVCDVCMDEMEPCPNCGVLQFSDSLLEASDGETVCNDCANLYEDRLREEEQEEMEESA